MFSSKKARVTQRIHAQDFLLFDPRMAITPATKPMMIVHRMLQTLSQQTGLSPEEILARLSKNLPDAVDKYTPEGRIPSAADFS
jgi:uncharacterized protein YidB (DUF937 family)